MAVIWFLAFSILVTVFNSQVASLQPTSLMTHKHVERVHVFLEDFCDTVIIFLEPLYQLSTCSTYKKCKIFTVFCYICMFVNPSHYGENACFILKLIHFTACY